MNNLPYGWEETTAGDLLEFVTSGSRGWAKFYCDHGASFIRVANLRRGSISPNLTNVQRVSPPDGAEGQRTRVRPNDILVSITADLGRVALMTRVEEVTYINQHVALARPKSKVNAAFLAWYLTSESAQRQLGRLQRGATKAGLGLSDIKNIRLALPPASEQERIVACIEERFTCLDAGVAALEHAAQKLRRMRTALYAAATAWPGCELPVVRFADVLKEPLRNGHSAKASASGTIPILTLTAVTVGDFGQHNIKMTEADPARVRGLWIQPGDLLIERSNARELVGTASLYSGPADLAVYPDLVIRARVGDVMLPEYAELVLKSPASRQYFQSAAQGISGSMPKIDQRAIMNLRFPLPSRDDQVKTVREVDRQLSLIDALQDSVSLAIRRSSVLRAAVLSAAFAGQLVGQDTNDVSQGNGFIPNQWTQLEQVTA